MFESDDYDYDDGLNIIIHRPIKKKEEVNIKPVVVNNQDILQAESNRHGILYRPDSFTGDNINEFITFNTEPEKKKNIPDNKNKFLPGERLLLTIQKERPELLHRPEYKTITTKRKSKLKNIIDKSR